MSKLQEIIEISKNTKFKRVIFGGYNKEEVNSKITEIVELFEQYIKEVQAEQNTKIEEYEKKIQESKEKIEELSGKVETLAEEQEVIMNEKEKMRVAYKAYSAGILKQYSESLCSLSTEFSQILDNVVEIKKNFSDIESLKKPGIFDNE